MPIYALNSWFALRFVGVSIYLDTIRECYEAYVLYNFFAYLLAYVRMQPEFERSLLSRAPPGCIFPCCCCRPWRMGPVFLQKCAAGVIAYIVCRPLTTVIALICEAAGVYGNGEIRGDRAYPYLAAVNSFTQGWAMFCLVMFYMAFKHDLAPARPVAKVAVIKAILFFSFWQSVLIAILAHEDIIKVCGEGG